MKRWRLRLPSARNPRVLWMIITTALLLACLGGGVTLYRDLQDLQQRNSILARSLIHQLARAGHLALLADNRTELRNIAHSVLQTDPILGQVSIRDRQEQLVLQVQRPPVEVGAIDLGMARIALAFAGDHLPMRYQAEIPPPGEGSMLDPFGTGRADIGQATLELSQGQYRRESADAFYRAALFGLSLFITLAVTGYGIAWIAVAPVRRLRRRLRDLSEGEADWQTAPRDEHDDIERSLAAIGQRLSRSEDRARAATAALQTREQQLELASEHARNAARLRADLIAGMSHELRAPLTAILGHSDLLARGTLDQDQREYVSTVRKSARHLLALIDDVLEWSGLEAGKTSLDEVGFNLAETVEDTLTLLAPLAFEKDLELVHLIYQDVPVRLRGDPLRFQQILTNLVSNAIKFTEHGGVTVRLMKEDEDDERVMLQVSVADTGPGIAESALPRLFDMYERLGKGKPHSAGSGLGLAISKRLLEMMGGHITVDSRPGRGCDFRFTLPLQKSLHREQNTVPWAGLHGKRIWLQDDYPTARTALTHYLEAWGLDLVEMDTRGDLQACLEERAVAPAPDAVVIGLRAADADEPALLQLLADCRTAGLPVLTLVTSIDQSVHAALESAGAAASLPKSSNRLRLYRELCALTGVDIPTGGDSQPLEGIHALIAENGTASRHYLTALLSGLGAGVAQAEDGPAAITAWRKGLFPLVLIDNRMPGADGEEVVRRIRGIATTAAQPILIGITADPDPAVARRLEQAGANACLVKPFDEHRLLDCLRTYLPELSARARAESHDDNSVHAARLTADPEVAGLLAQELPEQLTAVETAFAERDDAAAQDAIHTLHGTAAFYALSELKAIGWEIEQRLKEGGAATSDDATRLRAVVDATLAELRGPRRQPDEGNRERR